MIPSVACVSCFRFPPIREFLQLWAVYLLQLLDSVLSASTRDHQTGRKQLAWRQSSLEVQLLDLISTGLTNFRYRHIPIFTFIIALEELEIWGMIQIEIQQKSITTKQICLFLWDFVSFRFRIQVKLRSDSICLLFLDGLCLLKWMVIS